MFQVKATFAVGNRLVRQGTVVEDGDPIMEGRESCFVPLDVGLVEQATAAPGESRAVKRPNRKGSKKRPAQKG